MKIRIGLLLCILFSCAGGLAQGIGTWKSYTSMNEIRGHARVDQRYWAATVGGVFVWDEVTGSFSTYTNAEGLITNDLTAVLADSRDNIWTGAANGLIHILMPDGSWNYVLDISQASQTSRRINRFVGYGDTLLICTDFGLSMYDAVNFLFGDTYSKFGTLSGVRVETYDAVVFNDSIWVAVSDGLTTHRIAVASLSNPNRLPPESWSLRTVGTSGLLVTALEVFNGQLYAGTTVGLHELSGNQWIPVPGLSTVNVTSLDGSGPHLLVCSSSNVYALDASGSILQFPTLPFAGASVVPDASGEPVVGSAQGLLTLNGSWSTQLPNGPASNQFVSVSIDLDGNIWAATGFNSAGEGILRFDGVAWKVFTMANSLLPTNDYYRVSLGCDGSTWASSWGRGVIEFPRGAEAVDTSRIFSTNVGMVGVAGATDYVVVSTVACDPSGNEWMSVNGAADGNIMVVRHPDKVTWSRHPLSLGTSRISTLWVNLPLDRFLTVDAFGNLWGGSRDVTYKGAFSLGNGGQIEDDVFALLAEQDGLPSNQITTIVVDKDNDVWVGTERGIAIILDTNNPDRAGAVAVYKPLNGLVISTIAVDPLNRKWVGTPDGVILLSSDGIQQIASYTVESTGGKLISNDVRSIAIDSRNGVVYFGTPEGLSALTTVAADPKPEFDELVISPNPFLLPSTSQLLIDGLVENSTVKVLGIDGGLVREIVSPGGRVGFWDGKDMNGEEVGSGIYILVAYSSDGSRVAKGKVAVVHR